MTIRNADTDALNVKWSFQILGPKSWIPIQNSTSELLTDFTTVPQSFCDRGGKFQFSAAGEGCLHPVLNSLKMFSDFNTKRHGRPLSAIPRELTSVSLDLRSNHFHNTSLKNISCTFKSLSCPQMKAKKKHERLDYNCAFSITRGRLRKIINTNKVVFSYIINLVDMAKWSK